MTIVYKYKSINSDLDMERLLDILDHHRIYMPTYRELNDPLEGNMYNFNIAGYAGISIPVEADEEIPVIAFEKEKFRILSLSDCCDDALMWAHYAGNYSGVCLCFDREVFGDACRRVDYCRDRIESEFLGSTEELDHCIGESLFHKYYEWSYEREARVVRQCSEDDDKFYSFHDGLKGIIIGSRMTQFKKDFLYERYQNRYKIMKTHIGYTSNRVRILPYDYRISYDGSTLSAIDHMDDYLMG